MFWPEVSMRKFYNRDTEWETFSASASFKPDEIKTDNVNSSRSVLTEIGIVLAGALGVAAAIDVVLMYLNVRPFV
jgi:hypothetical protein